MDDAPVESKKIRKESNEYLAEEFAKEYKKMKPLTAVIVGCGHRSRVYAEIALKCPDQLKIIALVDPDKHVRDMCKKLYGVPENMCFDDISQILPMGKIADCVINGTMDKLHISTSIPHLLKIKRKVGKLQ